MSDKSLYLNRYKCCIYDNDLKKHFKVIEDINTMSVRKQLNTLYGIQIDFILSNGVVQPGIKYIRKV